jgi:hypothetical protein
MEANTGPSIWRRAYGGEHIKASTSGGKRHGSWRYRIECGSGGEKLHKRERQGNREWTRERVEK